MSMVSVSSRARCDGLRSSRPSRWEGSRVRWAVAALAAVLAPACNKEAPAASAEPPAPAAHKEAAATVTPAAAAVTAPADGEPSDANSGAPAAAKATGEGFDVSFLPKGSYQVGKPGEAEIVLVAKEPFHVNEKYPYKFKLKETAGLKYAAPVVGKDAAKLEAQRATLVVPFTPEKAGKHSVAGLFLFSVCTDDKCLIERQELSLDIEAK